MAQYPGTMSAQPLTIEQAALHFRARGTYLDTAAIGLPPRSVSEALHDVIERWSVGDVRASEFDGFVNAARASFARIIGVPVEGLAVGSTVSSLVGLVASSVPMGAEVLCVDGDFTSLLFPFLVRQRAGEIRVRTCNLEALAEAVDANTYLVATSAVQSRDGRTCNLEALSQACRHFGALTLIDATQAAGWLPLQASRFDYLVAGTYKWLLAPRGTAFMSIRPELIEALRPSFANWYSGEDIWSSIYGAPLRLASSARRFDASPAWFMWVGCALALEFIERVGVAAIHAHDLRLAAAFAERLDRPASGSAIVSIPGAGISEALLAAGITASRRDGAVRVGFHLYNTEQQAIAAADAIRSVGR
jgi:selenocysteine lyase/cysteine desulfurase